MQLCSRRGRPAVRNYASYLISVTCCCCHLRLIWPTNGWLHTRSNGRVSLLPCFQAAGPSCLLVTFAQKKRCLCSLLEAVRHGILQAEFRTEPCTVHHSSKHERATCWWYHTEEERMSRLMPKQHICSFIKASLCLLCAF